MTYPPPSPIPVPPPIGPQPSVAPTTPARFGKIGFRLFIVATVVNVLSEIARAFARHALATSSPGVAENGSGFVTIFALITTVLVLLLVVAAVSFGIAGLIRRERPTWWSTLSIASFIITPLIGIIVGLVSLNLLFL